jgi:hypothetical protein
MELAGLEPAVSWVRSRRTRNAEVSYLQGIHCTPDRCRRTAIASDGKPFPPIQALFAISA